MLGEEPELWTARMQPNRGVTIPIEVIEAWGIPKGERAVLYFAVETEGRVVVVPAKDLKTLFSEESK